MDIVCSKKDFFKNPQKLPMHELYLEYRTLVRTSKDEPSLDEMLNECGKNQQQQCNRKYQTKTEKKHALDKCWLQARNYPEFHPFYPQFNEKENDAFLERNREFLEILNLLATCTFHQFWCYVACEPRISHILTHFLEHSLSPFAVPCLSEEFAKLYNEIYVCFFSIYERLLNFRLSETEFLPEAVALGFLKNGGLLHARTVYLFCFLYNCTSQKFVKRLIEFYFSGKLQEAHMKELTDMLVDVVQEFDKLECLELLSSTNAGCSVLRRKPDKFDPVWLEETSGYIMEMTSSFHVFLSVFKPAIEIIFELELPNRLSHIYQKLYVQLYEMLEKTDEIKYQWSRYQTLINQWLALGRSEFLNLFYLFSHHLLNDVLRLRDNQPEQEKYLERYLGFISAALDDDLFMRDYNKVHPVEKQFQLLIGNVPDFDTTQTDYLLISLQDMIEESDEEDIEPQAQLSEETILNSSHYRQEPFPEDLYESIYDTLTQYVEVQQSSSSLPGPSSSKTGSSSINLPEPVLAALKQYSQLNLQWQKNPNCWKSPDTSWNEFEPTTSSSQNPNVSKPSEDKIEQCIKIVLETLPHLKSTYVLRCLETMDYRPEQVISRVLDNDLPFDLLDIPQDSISDIPGSSRNPQKPPVRKTFSYIGKKPDYADAKDLLDDKKEKQDIKDLVLKASYAYDVDDDYDDRNEVFSTFERGDESKIYRHLKQSGNEYNAVSEPSSDSDDEEQKEQAEKSKNNFCEDPAVLRERRAAQRGRNYKPPTRDVVGRPKGQGQDSKVQQDRDKKNVHKGSRANHNRKGGAQWKHSKGMMPF